MTTTIPNVPAPPSPFTTVNVPPMILRDDFDAYEAGWLARDAALTTRVAELEAQIPDPVPVTVYGINASNKSQHDTAAAIYGAPPPFAWRYYHQPGESATYPTEYQLQPGELFILSTKIKNPTVAQLVSLFRSVPAGERFVYCPWHEPENDMKSGAFTAASYKSWFTTARQARDQVANPLIEIAVILMGYTWQAGSGRNPEDYVPADADFDMILADQYFAGSIGRGVDTIPTGFDGIIATAQAHGKAWGAAELGVGQKVSGQTRVDAVKLMGRTVREKGGIFACYFSTSQTGEWALVTDAEKQAWRDSMTG